MQKKITPMPNLSPSLSEARQHYNHDLADKFYKHVWAGDDIFIGLGWHDDNTKTIAIACQRMVDNMVKLISNRQLGNTRLLDLGAGYGATARYLARQYGFDVDCLNLSETQNAENRRLNHEHGLSDKILVLQGNFESLEFANETYHVVWSQDAFLHSENRSTILSEIDRVLQHGGDVVFTDILQSEICSPDALKPVLARFGLSSLATQSFYYEQAIQLGWQVYEIQDISPHLVKHYWRVIHEIDSGYDDLLQTFESDYLAKVRQGMVNWIKAGEQGYLKWGLLHFGKN
jgi:sarcosine/dimethylglycine N-methyltransferase